MPVRDFSIEDAPALARLAADCQRGENDFVLNPLWTNEAELFAEFERREIEPEANLVVAEGEDGSVLGMAGLLREPGDTLAGLICPIVPRGERGRGLGGELLRTAIARAEAHGVKLATAGVGTRNRSGYALLTAHGFRPVRQYFLMRCEQRPGASDAIDGFALAAAGEQDLQAILAIYGASGFEPRTEARMRDLFADGIHRHAVARREDGSVAAFAEIETHWPKRPWVAYVGVAPDSRGRGLGSGLVAWTLARCFDAGADAALLLLSPANREAMRAYEKVGFKRFRVIDVLERAV